MQAKDEGLDSGERILSICLFDIGKGSILGDFKYIVAAPLLTEKSNSHTE
jgi:hypothetical protein